MMKTKIKFRFSFYSAIVCLLLFAVSCSNSYDNREQAENFLDKQTAGAVSAESKVVEEMDRGTGELPTRFQNPSFLLEKSGSYVEADEFSVPVGADISSNRGPVKLRDILKRLAVLKQMNVSWAQDVNQAAKVDVDIRAEDDFYQAIENILRQLDYFYEIEGNSIVVKYRDTKTFQVAMPFLTPNFSTSVGGDVLGGSGSEQTMSGMIKFENTTQDDSFDLWANIQKNLNEILKVYSETKVEDTVDSTVDEKTAPEDAKTTGAVGNSSENTNMVRTRNKGALGYYMIDKPVGLITATAPRSLLVKIENYIEQLKKVIYQQVSIEAKIVEVTLSADTSTGLDWSNLLNGKAISGFIDLQHNTTGWRKGMDYEQFLSFGNISFSVLLDAMEEQGHVEVLANPRITVMNGQPALISVGTDTKYVSEITVTPGTTDAPGDKYSSTQDSVVSGLGLGVVATILNGDEVVLHLTPVTSDLLEMGEAQIGNDGGFVGLPVVRLRELSSTIRVKSGNMLVVGGLINSNNAYDENKVVGLGDVPLISKLFGKSGNVVKKTEMVILLRPVIID